MLAQQPYSVSFVHDIGHSVISVSCTPNFSLVVAGAVDRHIYGLNADGSERWHTRLNEEVWSTAVSADGSRIAAGTANKKPTDGTVYVLDSSGHILFHDSIGAPVWGVALSADGSVMCATSWTGSLYVYSQEETGWQRTNEKKIARAGAYGLSISDDAAVIAAVSYDEKLAFYNAKLEEGSKIAGEHFGYRTKITADSKFAITGLRNGNVILNERTGQKKQREKKLSQRPICGVAITPGARLCAAGGFDGHVHILTAELDVLWSYRTEGEVWSIDSSYDGRFLCVASGDGKIYALRNFVTDAALQEINYLESNLLRAKRYEERKDLLSLLSRLYLRYGLFSYGLMRFENWIEGKQLEEGLLVPQAISMLEKAVSVDPSNSRAHYSLAQFYERANDNFKAGLMYVNATRDSNLRQRGFTAAARCFAKSEHVAAAGTCFRRAREQTLHEDDLRILYNLARSLEDVHNYEEAKLYYDILLAWNPRYRDVARRSLEIDRGDPAGRGEIDYTGLTVNLLTPNTPRSSDVDPSLHTVVHARQKEAHVSEDERRIYKDVLKRFYGDTGIREQTRTALEYNVESYIKYDFLLPEDEITKELERVNTLALLNERKIGRSLDIGAATGRWPRTFASQGVEAFGVDIEEQAIDYAQKKLSEDERNRGFPVLEVGDGLNLRFEKEYFCLVTCMMGTFAHIAKKDHGKFFNEAHRVLRTGGLLLVSTWDIECRHQSYLSMYTFAEKQKIDENSLTQWQLVDAGLKAGFELERQLPIGLIADVLSFELGIKELNADALNQMLSIDLAARSTFPEMHGQMFLTLLRKPNA